MRVLVGAACVAASVAQPVAAAPKMLVQPVLAGPEIVRFDRGVPTVDYRRAAGAVQVMPLPIDHGSLSFSVVVWNGSAQAANFGAENVGAVAGPQTLVAFTKDQLVSKAENRAMWTQIGLAALGGLAAVSAANQRDHINATTYTPHGVYSTHISYRSSTADLQAAAAIAGTGVAIHSVQNRLDETRAALGAEIIQTTTVDPYDSYGGRVVLEKIKNTKLPQEITLNVNWNGETYPFTFRMAAYGTAWPIYPPPPPPPPPPPVPEPASASAAVPTPALVLPVVAPVQVQATGFPKPQM